MNDCRRAFSSATLPRMLRAVSAACLLLAVAPVACAIVLTDPMSFEVKRTWTAASLGIPAELGGLLFSADGGTLYVVGGSGSRGLGTLYAVPVTRDETTAEVLDIGPAEMVVEIFAGAASSLDAGLAFGPSGTLFYTYWDDNVLGQRPGGVSGDETQFDMNGTLPTAVSGLTFSPHLVDPATEFAQLQVSVFELEGVVFSSSIYDLPLGPQEGGLFDPGTPSLLAALPGQGVGGMRYVPSGPFAGNLMHVDWLADELRVMIIDEATGLPIDEDSEMPTRGTDRPVEVPFATDVVNAWGLEFDAATGDLFVGTNGTMPPNVIVQIGEVPETTTTTTTTSTSTTTSTTLPGCEVAPTFPSIHCRLDGLLADVRAAGDLGRVTTRLARRLERAGTRTAAGEQAAGEGRRRRAKASLAGSRRALGAFIRLVRGRRAQRLLPPDVPDMLRETARRIRKDIRTVARAI